MHFRPCANIILLAVVPKTITRAKQNSKLFCNSPGSLWGYDQDPLTWGVLLHWANEQQLYQVDFSYVNSLALFLPSVFFFFKQSFIDTCSVSWPLKCLPLQNDTHTKGFLLERLFPPQPPATKFIMINQYFICKYSFTCKEFGHVRINNPFNWISDPKNPFRNFNIALAHGKLSNRNGCLTHSTKIQLCKLSK